MPPPILTTVQVTAARRRAAMVSARRKHEARGRFAILFIGCAMFVGTLSLGWYSRTELETRWLRPAALGVAPLTAEQRTGKIVYELGDGVSCRTVAFDNLATWFSDSTTRRCEAEMPTNGSRAINRFTWNPR